jgi:hypothetical protein
MASNYWVTTWLANKSSKTQDQSTNLIPDNLRVQLLINQDSRPSSTLIWRSNQWALNRLQIWMSKLTTNSNLRSKTRTISVNRMDFRPRRDSRRTLAILWPPFVKFRSCRQLRTSWRNKLRNLMTDKQSLIEIQKLGRINTHSSLQVYKVALVLSPRTKKWKSQSL